MLTNHLQRFHHSQRYCLQQCKDHVPTACTELTVPSWECQKEGCLCGPLQMTPVDTSVVQHVLRCLSQNDSCQGQGYSKVCILCTSSTWAVWIIEAMESLPSSFSFFPISLPLWSSYTRDTCRTPPWGLGKSRQTPAIHVSSCLYHTWHWGRKLSGGPIFLTYVPRAVGAEHMLFTFRSWGGLSHSSMFMEHACNFAINLTEHKEKSCIFPRC